MSFRSFRTHAGNFAERRTKQRRIRKRLTSRQYLFQQLEDRRLLAGPELLAIRPDANALLQDGDTLNVAPRDFNLLFKGGADLDESSINPGTIKLVRSGGDGVFGAMGTIPDVEVALGYVGLVEPGSTNPEDLQQIVFRTASSASHNSTDPANMFPDDLYQIQIIGAGASPLENQSGEAFNDGNDLKTEFRLDRGAQVVSVVPQPITPASMIGGTLTQDADRITVYFDDQLLDPGDRVDPAFYRLVNTSSTLTPGDDTTTLPDAVSYNSVDNSVFLDFADPIPEGNFRLDIGRSGGDDSMTSSALQIGSLSDGNPFTYNAFLGDSGGTTSTDAGDVDNYALELTAGGTVTVTVTPHSPTLNLRAELFDTVGSVATDGDAGAGSPNTLVFPVTTTGTYFIEVTSDGGSGGTGSYRIDASVTGSPLAGGDDNSFIDTATDLGDLGAADVMISSQIERQSIPLPPRPGSEDEPGHRQIQRESHIGATGTTPTVPQATRIVRYYFPDTLGVDTSGNAFVNLISETEKQIVREIFEIYAQKSGYEFIETSATVHGGDQLMIGKGDMRSVSNGALAPGQVAGLASGSFAVLDGSVFNQSIRSFGDGFTGVMFHEIGHSLGLSHSYDIPSVQGSGVSNGIRPGDHDIVHLQRIVPPNSTDIDLYKFELTQAGRFRAETIAERLLPAPSYLNSVLTLYRQIAPGEVELVARNDQYFGADSFIDLDLSAGTYFIGVTSTGNTNYDPHVPDSGFGGTTDGDYDLKLSFEADSGGVLRDDDGTAIDGDGDGRPGGVHSFWFQGTDSATAIYVDKGADVSSMVDGIGTLSDPYDTISAAFADAASRIVVPLDGDTSIADGEMFVIDDGINLPVTFRFGTTGANPVNLTTPMATSPEDVATAISTAIGAAVTAGDLDASVTATVTGRVVRFSGINNLDIGASPTLLHTPNIVHIVGNGGGDGDIGTIGNNRPYLVGEGIDIAGTPLDDGEDFLVPQGVNVMIHAGVLIKLRKANLDAGTSSTESRSNASIQVLGTPEHSVFFRSYHNDAVGGDSDGVGPAPSSGDFGGIVFRDDSDLEAHGIFLNYVNHADINNGGGKVFVDTAESVFTPIHIIDARPSASFNRITLSENAAMSASPDSFDDSIGRIGPNLYGNFLVNNTIDGLFIRIETPLGGTIDKLTVSGRFNDTDIAHVLSENLIIAGGAGGPLELPGGMRVARPGGRLVLDPGTVLKVDGARLEAERGSGTLIAEGTLNRPVIITSLADDRFGGSGSFDSNRGPTLPLPGDWGGLYFGDATFGSIDNAIIAFGGGSTSIEGGAAEFNAIEVHQAHLRLANTVLQSNADGSSGGTRNGRAANSAAAIFVRGAQPIIVDNIITDNIGSAITINANALRSENLRDTGRSTGTANVYPQMANNRGPLVRLNRLENNSINAMEVRGEELTTASVWDDTDIVHVLRGEIIVGNHHTFSGLRLQSSLSESLVIKLAGVGNAGFTATGDPKEIIDRIGGTIHVLGTVGHPVVMTHLADDTVGAGFTPSGKVMRNTNNSATPSTGTSGGWRGLLFDEFSNDRNVAVIREAEAPLTNGRDVNATASRAQLLGVLAPDEKSGDENRRLGFQVSGFISPTDPDDVDVYSFSARAGTGIWVDIDRTDTALDAIVEVINAAGTVLARSVAPGDADNLNAATLTQNPLLGGDHYTQNFRDPGLFYMVPAAPPGVFPIPSETVYIRVRSRPDPTGSITALAGESRGEYQLQVRLDQVQEFPGSTVRFADIRHAVTAIDVRGLPAHSPLIGEAGEIEGNNSFDSPQTLVNLLETDVAALGISGALSSETDVDWYQFDLEQTGVQVIEGVNDGAGTIAVVFDIDYADNAVRGDTTIAVYDENQNLIYVGRESNVQDDQPAPGDTDGSIDDLSRGSLGKKDAYIGPIHLTPGGSFYVAVMSDRQLPTALTGAFLSSPGPAASDVNALVRLEPINSLVRVVEDHVGAQGYDSNGAFIAPSTPRLFDIETGVVDSGLGVDAHVTPLTLENVALYITTDTVGATAGDDLFTVDPFDGGDLTRVANNYGSGQDDVQDIVIRSDGFFYGYQRVHNDADEVGNLVRIDPNDGSFLQTQSDNILDRASPGARDLADTPLNTTDETFNDIATTDDVDALTFERTGTTGPASAPVPTYDLYYSVRETDYLGPGATRNVNSKLYRADAATGSAERDDDEGYGEIGDIQPAGVTFAFANVIFDDTTGASTVVRVESKIPGAAGNFTLNITRPNLANAVTAVDANARSITVRLDDTEAEAGDLVDLINNNATARQFLVAAVEQGDDVEEGDNAPPPGAVTVTPGMDGTIGPLSGRVTGLAFGDFDSSQLYGVTNAGEFLVINKFTGVVDKRFDIASVVGPPTDFEGLSLGPQNVEDGVYKNYVFAVTNGGNLYAIDTTLVAAADPTSTTDTLSLLQPIFAADPDGLADDLTVPTGVAGAVGLAFSPMDFNLWHPTTKRGADDGHGINEAPDGTREAVDGETSFHFGFEQWTQTPGDNAYLDYDGINAQFGILTEEFHQDLSSNDGATYPTAQIRNTYNFPAGALGSLTTESFSLAGSVPSDRPAVYVNYFLDTENHGGSSVEDDVADPFRDSARVFVSKDGGLTWELVASNNSQLSADDPTDADGTAELPGFLSHLSDAGLNSATPRPESQQIVQELMDNTDQWRQVRVDLSSYADETDLRLRLDFSTAGSIDDDSIVRIDDESGNAPFGEFSSTTRSIRSTDNVHEGFYIDDIIVGYAERGEMVTATPLPPDTTADAGITNLFLNDRTRDDDPGANPDIVAGAYQLEVRRTDEYVRLADPNPPFVGSIFDTNDRHINEATETAFISFEPSTFVPPLGVADTTLLGGFMAAEIEPWSVTTTDPFTGMQSLESGAVVTITKPVSIFEATATDLGAVTADAGVIRFAYNVSSALDTHGLRFFIDGVAQTLVVEAGEPSGIDTSLASGETGYQTVQFPFGAGDPTFTWVYDYIDPNAMALPEGDNRAFIDDVQLLQGGTGLLADRNRERAQGLFIIDSNFITDSSTLGINVQPGTTQANGGVPHPGSTINFPQLNNERLVPGIVIQNNVIDGLSSGIRFAGEATSAPQRPVPFARIINNTVAGTNQTGVGISVVGLASPTLMNNLLTDLGTGISDNGTGTVIVSNFFQDNNDDGDIGTDERIGDGDPLFVNRAIGNYYLETGSTAIDSSKNTEQDRLNFLNFKTEIGIPASPINAPDRDVYGQLRIDSNTSPGGGGSQIFKDRGAVDRADKDAPYAVLLNPIDNGLGDTDPADTVVHLADPLLEDFTILLGDGPNPNAPFEGTGVDGLTVIDPNDPTVSQRAVMVFQNGVLLEQDVDYKLGYNELDGILLLTPLSTLWEQSSVYTIMLDNTQIKDRAGRNLRSNQTDGSTKFFIIIPDVDIDYGDAPNSYRTLLASNGPRHIISTSDTPRLGILADGEDDGQPAMPMMPADNDDMTDDDDEDGLIVGSFVGMTATTEGLFLADTVAMDETTMEPSEVIAYLNPNDLAGSVIPVTVTGDGILDGWIDFNADGDFLDANERVLTKVSVGDGVNMLRVFTPSGATAGLTYARFRISTDGSNDSFGLAIDGEVEDYRVNVVDADAPILMDDPYSVVEDETLTVDGMTLSIFDNDTLPMQEFVHSLYRIDSVDAPLVMGTTDTYKTANGTVQIVDAATGAFTYNPDPDYYGPDSFRYAVSTQRNEGPIADMVATYATVSITVTPDNDEPGVTDVNLRTIEDIQEENLVDGGFLIDASVLLAGASGDGDVMTTLVPQDESGQMIFVQSISTFDGTLDAMSVPGAELATVRGGTISAVFDVDDNLVSVLYKPAKDFNSENLPMMVGDFLDDEFEFTVVDDGISPPVPATDPPNPVDPKTATATAFIRVTPQNDPPALEADTVSLANPDYVNFFAPGAVPMASQPTEDETLLIPAAFLLSNDEEGPVGTDDERTQFNGNDGPMQIIGAFVNNPFFGTITDVDSASGDITFVPADDIFGEVIFTYIVTDRGIDQAAPLGSLKELAPLQSTITATIFLDPVNDVPVAVDRQFDVAEIVETRPPVGTEATITITPSDLLIGSTSDLLNPTVDATASDITLAAPYNEDNQALEINSVTVEGITLNGSADGTLTTASGGQIAFDFEMGLLVTATYTPPVDYNSNFPVSADTFTYTIVDDGTHEFPVGTPLMPDTAPETSAAATVTLTVTPSNDIPVFNVPPVVNILERDDNLASRFNNFFTNVSGGPPSALDEASQTVTFTITELSSTSSTLMSRDPDVSSGSFIDFFPNPDEIGTATYEVTGTDNGSPNQSFTQTFSVNVQPVNDAPRLDPNVLGDTMTFGLDDAYSVLADGTIRLTLREDNTQAGGDTSAPYFIPATSATRIGLFDVWTVGPANEAAPQPVFGGGSQELLFVNAGGPPNAPGMDRTTALGGFVSPVFGTGGVFMGLNYRPPTDLNFSFAPLDSFTYVVEDSSNDGMGNETYDLGLGTLIDDPLQGINRVELVLNPVNDRPRFTPSTLNISVREDGPAVDRLNYALDIAASTRNTAFDEVNSSTGQSLMFLVNSLDFNQAQSSDFFSIYPSIDATTGKLNFRPAPDVFGDFRFELILMDNGSDNDPRGDLNKSIPVTMTINVRPVNDSPRVDPAADPLAFTILEDGSIDILVEGDNTSPGLLDPFFPGPNVGPGNESADIAPAPGANQSVMLKTPVPTMSNEGGTILFDNSGGTPKLVYTPPIDFVGTDSFVYIVTDNGTTVGADGIERPDSRDGANTVTIEVLPVNDAPVFSGAGDVNSAEDDGVVTIANWAANVRPGPATATDEATQSLEFVFTQLSPNPELFLTPPRAIVDSMTGTASLTYQTNPNANGTARFEVVLEDSGPRNASIGDEHVSSPPRVFNVIVAAKNDLPRFDLVSPLITRNEDSGPTSVVQAINISPGPADELGQTVSFNVEVLPPHNANELFTEPPTITPTGVLRFTPAPNQNTDNLLGPAVIRVTAMDTGAEPNESASAEFRIAILPVNDSPQAVPDSPQALPDPALLSTDEDSILVIDVDTLLLNDIDPDRETNGQIVNVVMPAQSVSVNGATVSYDEMTGTITYNPLGAINVQALRPGQQLFDSFAYSLRDAAGATSNLATVAIRVSGLNDAPALGVDTPQLSPSGPTVIPVLANDFDVDGTINRSSLRIELEPAFGTLVIQPDGTLVYNAFSSFLGEDIFAYTVADDLGARSVQSFVTISANASPIARNDTGGTFLDESVFINVAGNDSDSDGSLNLASIIIVDQPLRGQAIPQANGTVQYLPNPGFVGTDSFTYRISDNDGRASNVATVNTRVVASRLQNPNIAADVDGDGFVSAIDPLLIINKLDRDGPPPILVMPTDNGPPYYDVNGDKSITALDILLAINEINRRNNGSNTEQVPQAVFDQSESVAPSVEAPLAPSDLSATAKIVDTDVVDSSIEGTVDLIARDRDSQSDEDATAAAIDAALGDLL